MTVTRPHCSWLFSSADLTIAAGQLRQAVADTFVSLGVSWEMGKKFSGDDSGAWMASQAGNIDYSPVLTAASMTS